MRFITGVILVAFSGPIAAQSLPKLHVVPVKQDLTFWAISAVDDQVAWVSANKGTVARSVDGGKSWTFNQVKGFETREFRSIYAFDEKTAIVANVGSPAHILRTVDGGKSWSTVYENKVAQAFIDGIDFWNDKEGLAYGDPIVSKLLLIRTKDGGKTWTDDHETGQPILAQDEASFASSGTGIRCFGDKHAVIATGGVVSRLFITHDKGNWWASTIPFMLQGSKTGGIFSVAFRNEKEAIVVGGDFTDSLATDLGRYTADGGDTWTEPSKSPRGTRWCVEFIDGSTAVAVGPSGADISFDGGKVWAPLFNDRGYHVVRKSRKGSLVIVAGNKSKLAILKE